MSDKAMPLPWEVEMRSNGSIFITCPNAAPSRSDVRFIIDRVWYTKHIAKIIIAGDIDNARANAELIVRAVNAHEALCNSIEAALRMVDGDGHPPDWDELRAALKLARGVAA